MQDFLSAYEELNHLLPLYISLLDIEKILSKTEKVKLVLNIEKVQLDFKFIKDMEVRKCMQSYKS